MIYIAGCDGTGKSTQATLMLSALAQGGARVRHVWLRFPFMLSLPLLAFARWRGHSWSEEIDGVRHGYWNFAGSVILRALLPWALLIDAALAAIQKIYLPLLMGHTVVCERFALDMLADLAVAFDEPLLHRTLPARLFPYLVPPGATTVVLDLDAETIRARRSDLRLDRRLEARLEAFGQIAQGLQLSTLSSAQPIEVLHEQLAALANAA
jgi:thymidylate kinase